MGGAENIVQVISQQISRNSRKDKYRPTQDILLFSEVNINDISEIYLMK